MDARVKRQRSKNRARTVGIILLVVCFFATGVVFLMVRSMDRINLVIATDPVLVWSWDERNQSSVILSIPADTVVSAAHGLGLYPLSSIWKMGVSDSREHLLITQTLGDVVGIPVPWYIGFSPPTKFSDPAAAARSICSSRALLLYFSGKVQTNLSPIMYGKVLQACLGMRDGKTTLLALSANNGLVTTALPDGSKVEEIDYDRLDSAIGDDFEDAQVRAEALHVGVYNATGVADLGNRFTRLLTHMGISVVLVGNSDMHVSSLCQINGTKAELATITAKTIQSVFGCAAHQSEEEGRADLTVVVGDGYARVFAPVGTAR